MTITAVTFAPVQSFIRASRKLRDLYGSSLLLSHLARALADDASQRGFTVISPAAVSSSRGVPNVLIIAGDYRQTCARDALVGCWRRVLESCRTWLEHEIQPRHGYAWQSSWKACAAHSWELFHGQGVTIQAARQALAVNKQQRDWQVPNWTGESSTLSSAEAVVWPRMGAVQDPRELPPGKIQAEAREFLRLLGAHERLGEAFAGANEEIALSELVKRLITYPAVAAAALSTPHDPMPNLRHLIPPRFQELSMIAKENASADKAESIVWFMADGDGVGAHLQSLAQKDGEEQALQAFSKAMRRWAAGLYDLVPDIMEKQAMVVYAGGDDLFGALHESEPGANNLKSDQLWRWLRTFPEIWKRCRQVGLTVSMGLVWADAKVPQREALQHARDAEASAKARGKNRFALRLVYNGGNHLEWTCPWSWLNPILEHYTDREGRSLLPANSRRNDGGLPSWRHLAEDLQWLQARQAIAIQVPAREPLGSGRAAGPFGPSRENAAPLPPRPQDAAERTARALWDAYFPGCVLPPEPRKQLASQAHPPSAATGVDKDADEQDPFRASFEQPEKGRRFDQWLLDLGRVMAGLEKHSPSKDDPSRKREEVPA
jgi:CRISPR-associated protein Cmr2